MKTKYKYQFDRIVFMNRWAQPFYMRNSTWTIFGLRVHWFSPLELEYQLCFFGFDIRIWINRKIANP